LGSGSGLDVIEYPTCSYTCSLGAITHTMTKLLLYLTIILATIPESCKQHSSTIAKENQLIDKYTKAWDVVVLDLGGQKITIYRSDNSAELKKWDYTDSLTKNGKISTPTNIKTENVNLKPEEVDSIYFWTKKLIADFNLPDKYCTDYVGHLRLTIAYGKQVNQSCEYKSICDWKLLAPETTKLNVLLKSKFPKLD
jgi:hypothetical protein